MTSNVSGLTNCGGLLGPGSGTSKSLGLVGVVMALLEEVCHRGGGALRSHIYTQSGQCDLDLPLGCLPEDSWCLPSQCCASHHDENHKPALIKCLYESCRGHGVLHSSGPLRHLMKWVWGWHVTPCMPGVSRSLGYILSTMKKEKSKLGNPYVLQGLVCRTVCGT